MADTQQATLQDYINKLYGPTANLGLKELTSLLNMGGQGVGTTDLYGTGVGTLTSILPLILGDKSNPVLNMMAGNLANAAGSIAGISSGLPQSPATSLINMIAPQLGINVGGEFGTYIPMAAGAVAGDAGATVIPMANPLAALGTGMSEGFTNPYSGYLQLLDAAFPVLGSALGGMLEGILGTHEKGWDKIKDAIGSTSQPGYDRLATLRDMGLSDYDIYAYAKANNLYTEGSNDQLTGVWTGPEANAMNSARGAWGPSSDPGWRWDPGTGQWAQLPTGSSFIGAYQAGEPAAFQAVADAYSGPSQKEAPSIGITEPDQLLGSPTRTPFSERSSDPAAWGQVPVTDPVTHRVVWENGRVKMQDAYNADQQWFSTYSPNQLTFEGFLDQKSIYNTFDPEGRKYGYYDPTTMQGIADWLAMHPEDISKVPDEIKPFIPQTSQFQWTKEIANPAYNEEMYQKYLASQGTGDTWGGYYEGMVMPSAPANPYEQYNVPKTITQNYWSLSPEEQLKWVLEQMGSYQQGISTASSPVTDTTAYGTPAVGTAAQTLQTATQQPVPTINKNTASIVSNQDVYNQYLRNNPNYTAQQPVQNRLSVQKSVPTLGSGEQMGQWLNPEAWNEIWKKTLYNTGSNSNTIYGY